LPRDAEIEIDLLEGTDKEFKIKTGSLSAPLRLNFSYDQSKPDNKVQINSAP
jgi:hypothetical protein